MSQDHESSLENDDYWNETPEPKKGRGRNFFDETTESPPVSPPGTGNHVPQNPSYESILRAAGLDDETVKTPVSARPTSVRGTVNASRQPAPSPANGSVRYSKASGGSQADSVSLSSTGSSQHSNEPSHRRSVSDASSKITASDPAPPPSTISAGSTSSIDEEGRQDGQPSHTEMAQLIAKNNKLERDLKKSKFSPRLVPIADTVTHLITGERYSLEQYKVLREKLALLDSAVGNHDGNAILAVVIFLKKTLSRTLFYDALRKRPDAVNQYLAYLKIRQNDDVAKEMMSLGRMEEASMWRFRKACEKTGAEERQKAVLDCYSHTRAVVGREYEADMMNEYQKLLYRQNEIEPRDAQAQKNGIPPFRAFPRSISLYFHPMITTLFYCCFYHYPEPETYSSSPLALKKEFGLSEKQYLYTALRARGKGKDWNSIDSLFTAKNWRGKAKFKAPMKFEKVVEVLAGLKAEDAVLDKYLRLVEDTDARILLAKRYIRHNVIVDTLAELKDRQGLEQYRSVIRNRPEENYLQAVIDKPNIKWKN